MKRIIKFIVLGLITVQSIFGLNLCFPEKYDKYENLFNKTYNQIVENGSEFQYQFFQSIDDYMKSLSLYKCDVAMIEPFQYDQYYDLIYKINKKENVNETLTERMKDEIDGEIYTELIKDLQFNGRDEVHAFPLFLDYGILYYLKKSDEKPPEKWDDIINKDYSDLSPSNSIYIGQFSEYRGFFYNLFENVFNTNDEITYDVVERETLNIIKIFKNLFDKEIIDEYAWHLNSEYAADRFIYEKAIYMRNWSSYLRSVTYAIRDKYLKEGYSEDKIPKIGITKTLFDGNSKTAGQSRAINKGIYMVVSSTINEADLNEAILVAKTFSSKEFMKLLIEEEEEEVFYDIPAYHSLIQEGDKNIGNVKNEKYCDRINCEFFRELEEDHVVASYSKFYQSDFEEKLYQFHDVFKKYMKSEADDADAATLDSVKK